MKKNILCVFALILALITLVTSITAFAALRNMEARFSAQLELLSDQYARLSEHIDSLAAGSDTASPETGTPEDEEVFEPYARLDLGDWSYSGGNLIIETGFAQVMAKDAIPVNAAVIIYLEEDVVADMPLQIYPGEASNSYEMFLEDLVFPLPELYQGAYLDISLTVGLSDETQLFAYGSCWEYLDGELVMSAG